MNFMNPVLAAALITTTAASSAAAADHEKLSYPHARSSDQVDDYFGTKVHDPYRWMEDVDSSEVKQWVDAENTVTQSYLARVPRRAAVHSRLMELNDFERYSAPEKAGGRYFFRRNSGLQNQSVLFWQQGLTSAPQILLDPNIMAADGTVALDSYSPTDDGKLLAYATAEAGSDLQKIRVRDVATGKDLPDLVEWVKFSRASWKKDGNGFFYSSYGVPRNEGERAAALKAVNVNQKVYFHKLGTPQTDDKIVFERPDDKELSVGGGVSEDGQYLVLYQGKGHLNALSVRDLTKPGAPLIQIAPVADASYDWIANDGAKVWIMTNKDTPKGRVALVDLAHPEPANWKTVIPEGPDSLQSVNMVHDTLIANYLVDAKSSVELHARDGALIKRLDLPGIGITDGFHGKRTDDETFFGFTNYVTPGTIYRLDLKSAKTEVWRAPKLKFDPAAYETKQVFATSKDGTRVPIFVSYKKGTPMDGSAPAILYGYGGFNISLGPAYSSSRLAWMEMGGVYAEAILRGGGEYGEKWHDAGTRLHKQNVFDDFIASAEFLIAKKYTSPKKLAINGGSNGGLLVGAVELQRPDLFGAVLAQVGVMDMLRFDKFTIGYAWKPDYGSPSDNEAEFHAIYKYSPLHNIKPGVQYPPTFITTADHDDRVFPAHSFKFAATMQAAASETPSANPVLIRVETRAGHGGGMPLSKQVDVTADMYAFLIHALNIATPTTN